MRSREPYTASCLAIEMSTGRTASFSQAITVEDPEVRFAGKTAYMSTDGDFSDCPANIPAGLRFNLFKDAVFALRTETTGVRVMIARGKTHVMGGLHTDQPYNTNLRVLQGPLHLVAGPGTKPKPVLKAPLAADNYSINQFWTNGVTVPTERVFLNLSFLGPWNPDNETIEAPYKSVNDCFFMADVAKTLIHDCEFKGFATAVSISEPSLSAAPANLTVAEKKEFVCEDISVTVSNTKITNWENFGIYGVGFGRFAAIGCTIAQSPNSSSGGGKSNDVNRNLHNIHGPIRLNGTNRHDVYLDCTDLFTHNGWYDNGYQTEQACFRVNQLFVPGSHYNIQRTSMEGGLPNIAATRMNNRVKGAGALDILVDHCVLAGSHMSPYLIQSEGTGITLRNSVGVFPNIPRLLGIYEPKSFFFLTDTGGERTLIFTLPLWLYGNTFINHTTTANAGKDIPFVDSNNGVNVTAVTRTENNVYHAPNIASPRTAFAPLDQTVLWQPRGLGYKLCYDFRKDTLKAPWLPGEAVVVPFPSGRTAASYTPNARQLSQVEIREKFDGVEVHKVMKGTHGPNGFSFVNDTENTFSTGTLIIIELDRREVPDILPNAQATPPESIWSGKPNPGSSAIGAATSDLVPYDDIRGRVRPVHPSMGAYEVAG